MFDLKKTTTVTLLTQGVTFDNTKQLKNATKGKQWRRGLIDGEGLGLRTCPSDIKQPTSRNNSPGLWVQVPQTNPVWEKKQKQKKQIKINHDLSCLPGPLPRRGSESGVNRTREPARASKEEAS